MISNGAFSSDMDGSPTNHGKDFNLFAIYGDQKNIKRIFIAFNIVILCSLFAGIVILLTNQNNLQALFLAITLPLVLLVFPLITRKRFEVAATFLAVVLLLTLTIIATTGLGIHHLTIFGFPAILIVASLVIRKRTLIFLTIFAIACAAWLVFGEIGGLFTPLPLEHSVPGDFFSVATILIATAFMARFLTEALFKASEDVQKELCERKRAEERLAYDALHDSLTHLPNRTLLNDRLGQRFEHARRHPGDLFAVLFIDLDRFKVINNSLGHAVGDQLLVVTAQLLTSCLRPEDSVSRLSGDEFAILINELDEISDAVRVAERIQSQLASTTMVEGLNLITTASIGIAVYKQSYAGPQEMMRDADAAMYRAKGSGGANYAIFDDTMYTNALELLRLEADLKQAVENKEWLVYYQPIVTLPDRKIAGFEALVRWRHPVRGIVGPLEFIHTAEDTGLIIPIGEFVMRHACAQVKAWRTNINPAFWVSVNLSARQFEDQRLLNIIESLLAEYGLPGSSLQLEITESVAMKDFTYTSLILDRLAQLDIQISLDDFGNGYSSLGNLNRFPIRNLKIDPSFIQHIDRIPNNVTITTAIISMSHALSMDVVAEGVETEQQLGYLKALSCDKIQGNLISPASPAEKLESLLQPG